jgi:hypothetical protein
VIEQSGARANDAADWTALMNGISRRSALKAGGACLGSALVPAAVWGQTPDGDGLQRWIEQDAVKANAGSEKSWSARDAERLLAAMGDARIVMLGEPSHGAGTAFAAKARLVRLLHERRGFDVLAWESGLIDLERTEAGLRGDLDPGEAARRGILGIWSASAECQPLFAYAKASHSGARPLTMAGFDMQLTAPGTLDHFSAEVRAFVGTVDPTRRNRAEALTESVLSHLGRLSRLARAKRQKPPSSAARASPGPRKAQPCRSGTGPTAKLSAPWPRTVRVSTRQPLRWSAYCEEAAEVRPARLRDVRAS